MPLPRGNFRPGLGTSLRELQRILRYEYMNFLNIIKLCTKQGLTHIPHANFCSNYETAWEEESLYLVTCFWSQ